jgi:hypothetical protein
MAQKHQSTIPASKRKNLKTAPPHSTIELQLKDQSTSDDGRHLPHYPRRNNLANGHITYPQRPEMALSH